MTDTKHTPTPLEAVGDLFLLGDICIDQTMQENITRGAAIYNAAHIVKCVNMHDELVAALKEAENDLTEWIQATRNDDTYSKGDTIEITKNISILLKKAGAM